MFPEIFSKFGFFRLWHLTDIDNVKSILTNGLLARNIVKSKELQFNPVGYEAIIEKRSQYKDYVLSFVTPYNDFVKKRQDNHRFFYPNSKGLALLEIDLEEAVADQLDLCQISQGNLAVSRMEIKTGKLVDFVETLDWHSILDRSQQPSNDVIAYQQAEVLIPNRIPPKAIKNIWTSSPIMQQYLTDQIEPSFGVFAAPTFFANGETLPTPAVPNFANIERLPNLKLEHEKFGSGILIARLGTRLVAKFDDFGLEVVNFKELSQIDSSVEFDSQHKIFSKLNEESTSRSTEQNNRNKKDLVPDQGQSEGNRLNNRELLRLLEIEGFSVQQIEIDSYAQNRNWFFQTTVNHKCDSCENYELRIYRSHYVASRLGKKVNSHYLSIFCAKCGLIQTPQASNEKNSQKFSSELRKIADKSVPVKELCSYCRENY